MLRKHVIGNRFQQKMVPAGSNISFDLSMYFYDALMSFVERINLCFKKQFVDKEADPCSVIP